MKVLIFGSSGLVGKALMEKFSHEGIECVGVTASGSDKSITVDISESSQFDRIDFIPDAIINCASRIPNGKLSSDPEFVKSLFLTNVVGGVNITNWAVKNKVFKIINCSTLVVVKKPWPNPLVEEFESLPDGFHVAYCMSKLSQEQLMTEAAKFSETKVLHARLSAVYGNNMRHEGIVFNLLNKLILNHPIQLFNAENTSIDFIHVTEISEIFSGILHKNFGNEIVNVASGIPVKLIDLAYVLKDITASDSEISNEEGNSLPNLSNISLNKLHVLLKSNPVNSVRLKYGLSELIQNYKHEELNSR